MAFNLADPERLTLLRRIYWAKWGRMMGDQAEDVWQDVCVSMMVRDQGSNPYDESKGSASNYAYMVCRSVCTNARDKRREAVGSEQDACLERVQPFPWASGKGKAKGKPTAQVGLWDMKYVGGAA